MIYIHFYHNNLIKFVELKCRLNIFFHTNKAANFIIFGDKLIHFITKITVNLVTKIVATPQQINR
ncbi:hypothetical protein EAE90_19440 [Photorhabdus caribbeanensis]|nr:hypothetical protein [Photorhabdus caribbeanensis]